MAFYTPNFGATSMADLDKIKLNFDSEETPRIEAQEPDSKPNRFRVLTSGDYPRACYLCDYKAHVVMNDISPQDRYSIPLCDGCAERVERCALQVRHQGLIPF